MDREPSHRWNRKKASEQHGQECGGYRELIDGLVHCDPELTSVVDYLSSRYNLKPSAAAEDRQHLLGRPEYSTRTQV